MPISLTPSRIARLIVGSPSRFDLWLRLLHTASLECAAEIGVWKGDFAQAILNNFGTVTKYYMIDPWAHLPDWNKPFNVNDQTFCSLFRRGNAASICGAAPQTIPDPKSGRHLVLLRRSDGNAFRLISKKAFSELIE